MVINYQFTVPRAEASQLPILQVVLILRRDGGGWALPGGMVDPGEVVTQTLKREFMEEALDSTQMTEQQQADAADAVAQVFATGEPWIIT